VESDIAGWTAAGAERGVVTGYWILDTRYWILVTASAEHEAGYWILDTGYWILVTASAEHEAGYWMSDRAIAKLGSPKQELARFQTCMFFECSRKMRNRGIA